MDRRTFLGAAAGITLLDAHALAPPVPIIDTHIHLFDPRRPQGVPWPDKDDAIRYKPALPDRYRKITGPLGVAGAIELECSPWLEDNQWVLDIAEKDPIIVGTIGNLEPGKTDFRKQLERFERNRLFRGIRYGNLWGRSLAEAVSKPEFISDLKFFAGKGLVLDTANPDLVLIHAVVRLTDKVPDLRVVIDHLPSLVPPAEETPRKKYEADLQELGKRPQVYVKVSAVLRRVNGSVIQDVDFYRPRLDELWSIFGQDRLLYGSDWPNSDPLGSYAQVLRVVQDYFNGKGQSAAEKYFWKNSLAAYRWVKRDASQPN